MPSWPGQGGGPAWDWLCVGDPLVTSAIIAVAKGIKNCSSRAIGILLTLINLNEFGIRVIVVASVTEAKLAASGKVTLTLT